jgi:hypothetical protein
MAPARQVHVRGTRQLLDSWRKLPWRHFRGCGDVGHALHLDERTSQKVVRDKHRFAANPNFLQLALVTEILHSLELHF